MSALQAPCLGEAAAESSTPGRLGEVVGVVHAVMVSRVAPLTSRGRAGASRRRRAAEGRRRATGGACGVHIPGADAFLVLPIPPASREANALCATTLRAARGASPRTEANRTSGGTPIDPGPVPSPRNVART